MTTFVIRTTTYDIDLNKLLKRRLRQCDCSCSLMHGPDGVSITIGDEEQRHPLSEALARLLCSDLKYFELARCVDALPMELADKQAVLKGALQWTHSPEQLRRVKQGLYEYLGTTESLCLEGYLRFRMQDCLNAWREGVVHAAEERMLTREYTELMRALNAFVSCKRPGIGELAVCIHPDGSCTLTDDSDACIEYVDCSDDGIVSLLVGMAPARLTVYDLSSGAGEPLSNALKRVFAGRVRIYRS